MTRPAIQQHLERRMTRPAIQQHLDERGLVATCAPYQSTLDPAGTLRVAARPASTSQQGRWSCEFTVDPDGSIGAA